MALYSTLAASAVPIRSPTLTSPTRSRGEPVPLASMRVEYVGSDARLPEGYADGSATGAGASHALTAWANAAGHHDAGARGISHGEAVNGGVSAVVGVGDAQTTTAGA